MVSELFDHCDTVYRPSGGLRILMLDSLVKIHFDTDTKFRLCFIVESVNYDPKTYISVNPSVKNVRQRSRQIESDFGVDFVSPGIDYEI